MERAHKLLMAKNHRMLQNLFIHSVFICSHRCLQVSADMIHHSHIQISLSSSTMFDDTRCRLSIDRVWKVFHVRRWPSKITSFSVFLLCSLSSSTTVVYEIDDGMMKCENRCNRKQTEEKNESIEAGWPNHMKHWLIELYFPTATRWSFDVRERFLDVRACVATW